MPFSCRSSTRRATSTTCTTSKNPTHAKEIEQPWLDQVAATHENGWKTGQPRLGLHVRPGFHPPPDPPQPGHRPLREAASQGQGAGQVLRRRALLPLRQGRRHAPFRLLPDRGHRPGRRGEPPHAPGPPEDVRRRGGHGEGGEVRARASSPSPSLPSKSTSSTPRWAGSSWAARASSGPR